MIRGFIMKKSLIILPLAALILAGCNLTSGGGKKKKSSTDTQTTTTGGGPVGPSVQPTTGTPQGDTEHDGYRRVDTAPVNDKDYIYGIYQGNLDEYIFLNGDHHRDENGEYPFYLTTTKNVAEAVKIHCHYVDDTHFTIQIVSGSVNPEYNGKYLEIYEGEKSDGSKVTSLRASTTEAQWEFMESYTKGAETFNLHTNVQVFQGAGYSPQPVTMATYEEYETFSACTPNHFADNFLSHLWEPIS